MGFLNKLFGKKEIPTKKDFTEEEHQKDYELKSKGLESILGKMHNLVGHAIVPFAVDGAVDMYYFPNHIKGTGFATMELLDPDGNSQRKIELELMNWLPLLNTIIIQVMRFKHHSI